MYDYSYPASRAFGQVYGIREPDLNFSIINAIQQDMNMDYQILH